MISIIFLRGIRSMADAVQTKRAIADSLKALSKEKPFDKISVGDIAAYCNVNRQTFYYHFQDKYDLLTWIYYEDYYKPSLEGLSFDTWDSCMERMLVLLREDKVFAVNTIKHAGEDMIRIFLKDTENILGSAIDLIKNNPELAGGFMNAVDTEEQRFIARFFAYGVCGIIMEWVQTGMKEDPGEIASRMRVLLESIEQLAFRRVLLENKEK